jgi:hypothetical protein
MCLGARAKKNWAKVRYGFDAETLAFSKKLGQSAMRLRWELCAGEYRALAPS